MPPVGRYATLADLCRLIGILARSDEEIQKAIDQADAEIISLAVESGRYTTPLEPLGNDVQRVKRWAVVLTASRLGCGDADQVRNEMRAAFASPEGLNATRKAMRMSNAGW